MRIPEKLAVLIAAPARIAREDVVMTEPRPRLLIVVGRDSPSLADHLMRAFADEPLVAVIVDRRVAQRRQRQNGAAIERRTRARRSVDIEDELRVMGCAMLTAESTAQGARWTKRKRVQGPYTWRRTVAG